MTQHVNKIKELYVLIGPEILRTFAWYFWNLQQISSPSTFNIQIDRTVCDYTDYRVSICFD